MVSTRAHRFVSGCAAASLLAAIPLGIAMVAAPASAAGPYTVNSLGEAGDANTANGVCETATAGECTLRAAAQQANADGVAATINLPAGQINLTSPVVFTVAVTLNGAGSGATGGTVVNAAATNRLIQADDAIVLNHLRFTNGDARAYGAGNDGGGAVWAKNDIDGIDLAFIGNHAAIGGAIYQSWGASQSTPATFDNVLFENNATTYNNTSTDAGGAIWTPHAVELNAAAFRGNSASSGGAIFADHPVTVTGNSRFETNTATGTAPSSGEGGAIYVDPDLTVTDVVFSNNTALAGGAAWLSGDDVRCTRSTFDHNSASAGDGGAVYSKGYDMFLTSCGFDSNVASGAGGGIWFGDQAEGTECNDTSFTNNRAGTEGGGMWTSYTIETDACDFINNRVESGGGGGLFSERTVTMTRSTVRGNGYKADGTSIGATTGGGVYARQLTADYSAFVENVGETGGGIYSLRRVFLTNVTVFTNQATVRAGGAYINGISGSSGTISFSTIAGNTAPTEALLAVGTPVLTIDSSLLGNGGSGIPCTAGSTASGDNNVTDTSAAACLPTPLANDLPVADLHLHPLTVETAYPRTPIVPLRSSSAAFNHIPTCVIADDQRGVSRPQDLAGTRCDAGAYEANPAAPSSVNLTSTDVINTPQSVTAEVPDAGSITLLDGSTPTNTVTIAGQGTYTLNPATGVITFTPATGYYGTPTPVSYRVSDVYARTATATYSPTVTLPPPPAAAPKETTGGPGETQTTTVTVPEGGSVTLLNGDGQPVTAVTVAGQGTYSLNAATGTIVFTPQAGFTGTPTPVSYRVTDAYGQSATSTYAPSVVAGQTTPTVDPFGDPSVFTPPELPRTGSDRTPLAVGILALLAGVTFLASARFWARDRARRA